MARMPYCRSSGSATDHTLAHASSNVSATGARSRPDTVDDEPRDLVAVDRPIAVLDEILQLRLERTRA